MSKFLFVIDCLGSGGAQRQIISIAKLIKQRGEQVEFFIYYDHLNHFRKELENAGIPIHIEVKRSRFSLKPIWALHRLWKKEQFDSVLAFMQTPAQYVALAKCVSKLFGNQAPVSIFSERTTYDKKLSITFKLSQQLHRFHDYIVANSHHQRKKMVVAFPWMRTKLSTIYNGIDTESFKLTPDTIAPRDDEFILCVSRVVQYKNYKNLAKSLIILKKEFGLSTKILWVGKVFDDAANIRELTVIKKELAGAGLENALEFLGEQADVAQYYQQAKALIHPSFIEGFSNVVMEATRYKLPLLLGNIGDHVWLLEQFSAGEVFDVNDPESIAKCIASFLELDQETLLKYKENSHKASNALFSISVAADAYLTLLKGVK